jgi:DNA-binding MarR family transcriptional regulator
VEEAANVGIDVDRFEQLLRAHAIPLQRDADPEAMSLVFVLARLSGQVLVDLDTRVHRPRGWSLSGYRIMLAVLVAGPLEPRQIAPLAGVTRASISAVLNTLERDGLVDRRRDSPDRRVVTIALTDRGRKAVLETVAEQHQVEREWVAPLDDGERRTLTRLMRKMLRARADDGEE